MPIMGGMSDPSPDSSARATRASWDCVVCSGAGAPVRGASRAKRIGIFAEWPLAEEEGDDILGRSMARGIGVDVDLSWARNAVNTKIGLWAGDGAYMLSANAGHGAD